MKPVALKRINKYEVVGIIGRGGMGVVLKGSDPALGRVVAIKILAPELSHLGSSRLRFAREARAAASVAHEHVVFHDDRRRRKRLAEVHIADRGAPCFRARLRVDRRAPRNSPSAFPWRNPRPSRTRLPPG